MRGAAHFVHQLLWPFEPHFDSRMGPAWLSAQIPAGDQWPTVSDLDVFGCELELLNLQTQQPLPEAFRTGLLQRPQLQIVVRRCMVDGHSIWQFQDEGQESYPKAVRVPPNPRGAVADRAFMLHLRSGM